MSGGKVIALLGVMLNLLGCSKQASVPAESPFRLTASIQDLMLALVDPAADALWESVGTTIDATGTHESKPTTEADWLALRHRALSLMEATNLLIIPGRQVAEPGIPLQDANLPGILAAADIQISIDKDRATFIDRAHALNDAAMEALKAIDSKNVDALQAAGGTIDEACEQCHLKYWYPPPPAAAKP